MKCTDIIELCTYTDISFWFQLFVLPSWLACRQGLAAARLFKFKPHLFNWHQPLVFLPPCPPAFLAGLGADSATVGTAAGSSPPAGEQQLHRRQGAAAAAPGPALPASSIPASSLGVVPASSWSSNRRLTILVLGQPLAPWILLMSS